MCCDMINLVLPLSRTVRGPLLRREWAGTEGDRLIVDYDYEQDDGSIQWARIIFEEILFFEFRIDPCSRAEDIVSSRKMRCLSKSPVLDELLKQWMVSLGWERRQQERGGAARFKHFTIWFDNTGTVNVVAARVSIEPKTFDTAPNQ